MVEHEDVKQMNINKFAPLKKDTSRQQHMAIRQETYLVSYGICCIFTIYKQNSSQLSARMQKD